MDQLVFRGYGIDIIKRENRFFILYDSGEIASRLVEAEITYEEARKAQRSERDAYEVIIATQAR